MNFVICDDNLSIVEKLTKSLESIFVNHNFDAHVAYSATDAESVLKFIDSNKVDVLILDINLKTNISGLDLARKVRKTNKYCYLIFLTGHLEYAMLAYKLKTFDYLPKPITYERIDETIVRLFEDINGLPKKYIKIDNKNTIIDEAELFYIKKDGMKLVFHTSNRDYETYGSFSKIEPCLPSNFVRCHKSYIVNVNRVSRFEFNNNMVFFDNNSCCDIGPKFKDDFMEVLNNYGIFE
jgi:two-component system response regulator AgrA